MSLKRNVIGLVILIGLVSSYFFYPTLRIIIYYLITPASEVSYKEVDRVPSPDSMVDAVVIRTNINATTSYGYHIHIVPAGSKPDNDRYIFRADHFEGWKIMWNQSKLLDIQYDEARIFHFSNFWQSIDFKNAGYVVEIRLLPRSPKYSLSARDRGLEP